MEYLGETEGLNAAKQAVGAVLKRSQKTDEVAATKPMADAGCMCKPKQQVEIARRNHQSKSIASRKGKARRRRNGES
jgi:hypothetical protein